MRVSLLAGIAAVALLSAGTALAGESQSLSVAIDADKVTMTTGAVTWDPRTKQVTVDVGDRKPVTIDVNNADRLVRDMRVGLRKFEGRVVSTYKDVIKE